MSYHSSSYQSSSHSTKHAGSKGVHGTSLTSPVGPSDPKETPPIPISSTPETPTPNPDSDDATISQAQGSETSPAYTIRSSFWFIIVGSLAAVTVLL
mmetsp:Transcript_24404/g.36540  ORF Transcript_24404/g.36540 Transcript_24404/m.36540 type:complete len:97 (-) Transcript_24404:164-454(-)